jgi:hypothetical protein
VSTVPDLTILRDFSAPSPVVVAPTLARIHPGKRYRGPASVLAFDQSLANCGWVHLQTTMDGAIPSVVAYGVIKSRAALNLRSNIDALIAHDEMIDSIVTLVRDLNISGSFLDRMEWVHETPPNAGRVVGSGVSSMLAAAAVRAAAREFGKAMSVVGAQTVKKAVTGSARSEKPAVRAAIDALDLQGKMPTNEHTREALGVGLVRLDAP